jgi:hypothetical protein
MQNKCKYKRKSERPPWLHENMRGWIVEVLKGGMGYMKASKEFGVQQNTLRA